MTETQSPSEMTAQETPETSAVNADGKFSFYNAPISDCYPHKDFTIEDFINAAKSGKYKNICEKATKLNLKTKQPKLNVFTVRRATISKKALERQKIEGKFRSINA